MGKYLKILRQKPSLTTSLRFLEIDAVDLLPNHIHQLRFALTKYLGKQNLLRSLKIRCLYDERLLDDIMEYQGGLIFIFFTN